MKHLNLNEGDVDLTEVRLLTIRRGKNGKARFIPIAPCKYCQSITRITGLSESGSSVPAPSPFFLNGKR